MHTYKCYPSALSARQSLYNQLTAYACVYIHVGTKCVSCEVIHTWIVVNFQKSPFGCCCMCFISKKHDLLDCTSMVLSPSLQNFTYYAFEQCLKLPIMFDIMPITTAIMPQFIATVLLLLRIALAQLGSSLLRFISCCAAVL